MQAVDVAAAVGSAVNPTIFYAVGAIPGDYWAAPIQQTGYGASYSIDLTNSTTETLNGETDLTGTGLSGTLAHTIWVAYTSPNNGVLTISQAAGAGVVIMTYQGTSLDSLELQSTTVNGPAVVSVVTNGVTFIRFGSVTTQGTAVGVSLAMAPDASQAGDMQLVIKNTPVTQAPSSLRVSVQGAPPSSLLDFEIVGTTAAFPNVPGIGLGLVASYTTDAAGNVSDVSLPLAAVSAGTYSVRVTVHATTQVTVGTFQVLSDPPTLPTTQPADSTPTLPTQPNTVVHWALEDAMPGGRGVYVFPINPSTMTSPHAPRNVAVEHTSARAGQWIIWEGQTRASEWHFQGAVRTQAFYEELVAFLNLNRRFYVVDHRSRGWICSFESIDWTKLHEVGNDWAWTYAVSALIFQGPVTPL